MNSMGDRLRAAIQAKDWEPKDLIARTKLVKGTIYNILNGTTKPEKVRADTATRICQALGVSRDWLIWGRGPMQAEGGVAVDETEWEEVRASEQAVALGGGAAVDEYAETHKLKFKASSLRKKGLRPHLLEVYYGSGDSMEPRIRDGDAILFDTSDTRIVDDAIYVIRHDGHVYAKRLQKLGDDLVAIVSDNRADPQWRKPVVVRPADDFEVLGRVRWIGSWED